MKLSFGRPTNTSVPLRRNELYACSNAFGDTAVTIAWSAPPSFWISAATSCVAALIVNSAPRDSASSSFSSVTSTAMTRPPAIAAYWTARWPRPPTPNTATRSDERVPATLTALYVVTPAQVSGDASAGLIPYGTLTTYFAKAFAYSAIPPSIVYPIICWFGQRVSQPETQYSHDPHA